ncbi:MAG: hypothetical protein HY926_10265 [Elusimicrobia bacterium]|nr:hypothetical protein [Elusimicrobiota bacterium]
MNWDGLIESVAFGKTTPKLSSSLGMYLSPDTIYIAQTSLDRSGKLRVEHLVRIPVPVPEGKSAGTMTGTLNTSFLTENQKLGGLIQQSMSQFKWSSKNVMVTLSHHLGLLRYFTMPAIERRFWKSAVPVEAKKYIPIPFEALNYDYQCIPLPHDSSNRARQGTLIAVTQKQNLANISAMLQGLGLSIAGMEVAPCSTLKLWQVLSPGTSGAAYCHVHFDGGNVRILVADKGFPVFFREVFLGEEANLADQRKLDLGGCITFSQKQLAVGALGGISVSGSTANLAAWKDAFSRELGLPVAVQDTPALLGIKSGDWGGYSAIGASLRFQVPSTVFLDLGAIGRVTEDEKTVARDFLAASALFTAGLLLMGLLKFAAYIYKAREFRSLQRDRQVEEVFRGKSENDIQEMFRKMRAQNELTLTLCGQDRIRMTDILKDVVETLPEKSFIFKLLVNRPAAFGVGNAPSLSITGHAVGENTANEQDLSFRFRDQLAKTPAAGKLFPDLKMTVQAADPAGLETGAAANSEEHIRKIEDRTTFTLTGTKGR